MQSCCITIVIVILNMYNLKGQVYLSDVSVLICQSFFSLVKLCIFDLVLKKNKHFKLLKLFQLLEIISDIHYTINFIL